MVIGLSTSGAILIKTDAAGGGPRVVNCSCCGLPYYEHTFINDNCDVSYWQASVFASILEDGSVLYTAEFSSAFVYKAWTKSTAANEAVDFSGVYSSEYDDGNLTITVDNSGLKCDSTALLFSQGGEYADCDGTTLTATDVYACKLS